MTADPWGLAEPPLLAPDDLPPLPDHLTPDGVVATGRRDFPHAGELPEVRALAAEGWEPLDDAPLHRCVPAVWPPGLRGWVPDRLPRIMFRTDGRRSSARPWDDETEAMMRDDVVEAARAQGLPAPPDGRRWLLRSPWPTIGLDVVLALAYRWAVEAEPDAPPEDEIGRFVRALPDFLALDEDAAWRWWAPDDTHVARRWRAAGRVGPDAAPFVLADLSPDGVRRLTAAPPDGGGLTERQALVWVDAVGGDGDAAVDRVLAWRRLGLPADPPGQDRLFGVDPADVAGWLVAGFDLDAYHALGRYGTDVATRWRAAGLDAATTAALLDADPTLTVDEALAFDTVDGVDPDGRLDGDHPTGIGAEDRVRWVAAGFTAAEAAAWAAVDVLPNEARAWRAQGLRPGDVPDRPRTGPDDPRLPDGRHVGWFAWGGDPADRRYGVADPPGTRGRLAAEAAAEAAEERARRSRRGLDEGN